MAVAGTRWSCTKFMAADKTYFASVAAHDPQPGGEEGTVDLAVTDGEAAWTAAGLTSADLKGAQAAGVTRLRHLLSALSELDDTQLQYSHSVKREEGGSLTLIVDWQPADKPAGLRLQVRASLVAAAPAGPVLAGMLGLLVDNLAVARATTLDTLAQLAEMEKHAAKSQELVDRYVNTKKDQDRETNAKVAALLNSKKRKLRELQRQLQEAQEEIQRLNGSGGGGAVPMEAGGSAEQQAERGAPGSSKQQQQQHRKGKAQVVEDSSDDGGEEEGGLEDSGGYETGRE